MPDNQERERALAVYASEIRAYHTFFWLAFLAAGVIHLLVLVPFLQARASLPQTATALERGVHEEEALKAAQRALASTSDALVRFRKQLDSGPLELYGAIAEMVKRGEAATGAGGDPYSATIRLAAAGPAPSPGPSGAGAPPTGSEEDATVEEAIRRQIGIHSEALTLALDSALEPLGQVRAQLPMVEGALRTARNGIARNVLELNPALRGAFAADRGFWQRWQAPGASYGAASVEVDKVARGIDEGLRALKLQLAAAGADVRNRLRATRARIEQVSAGETAMKARLEAVTAQMGWLPAQPAEVARFLPVLLGGLSLTVLLRLRRLLEMRRAIGASETNPAASSWLVGAPSYPGGWWSLTLSVLPLIAAIHASVVVLADPGLFTTPLGDPDRAQMIGFGAAYAALLVACTAQVPSVTRGLVTGQRKRG